MFGLPHSLSGCIFVGVPREAFRLLQLFPVLDKGVETGTDLFSTGSSL